MYDFRSGEIGFSEKYEVTMLSPYTFSELNCKMSSLGTKFSSKRPVSFADKKPTETRIRENLLIRKRIFQSIRRFYGNDC